MTVSKPPRVAIGFRDANWAVTLYGNGHADAAKAYRRWPKERLGGGGSAA